MMMKVGIDIVNFMLYSIRVVFVLVVFRKGLFLEIIMVVVGWLVECIFVIYYKKDVKEDIIYGEFIFSCLY